MKLHEAREMPHRCQSKCYRHWSEWNLQKYEPFPLAPASEQEMSSPRLSRSVSSMLQLECRCTSPKRISKRCLCCNTYCRSAPNCCTTEHTKKAYWCKPQKMQDNLRLELIRAEVHEAMADDKQIALTKLLDRTTAALEAFIQHMQSLQISYLSAYRIFEISHQLLISYPSLENFTNHDNQNLSTHVQQADIEKEKRLVTLQNLIDYCLKDTVILKELHISLDDYWMRREEFFIATRNFKNFLNGSKLSIHQMEKLHRQYNEITYQYQQSRRVLECELPKVISTRLETLRYGFEKISDFYLSIDCTKQATTIFKVIREGLHQDYLYAAKEQSHNNIPLNKEVCEKCKMNSVKQQT